MNVCFLLIVYKRKNMKIIPKKGSAFKKEQ